ncbi:MAG TPA: BatA domain-containing protein [Pirellulales bacterium]|jgi:hypothetical protein|nr:BatA domain-containing protein [Pirellulales bacterium]
MSLLAPLYIAGLLGIALPIVFHLIRRAPRGTVAFSSLMFLRPTPPRVTRRSRLNDLLLLILRGLALLLLALAFARPLWREAAQALTDNAPGRRIVLLVDRSASMRRADLWPQAQQLSAAALQDTRPADEVALVAFADQAETLISFESWTESPPAARQALARSALASIAPTWEATQLGSAIVKAAELVSEADESAAAAVSVDRQVILITDLQQGAHLAALEAYSWPKGVTLEVRPVATSRLTSASLQLARTAEETPPEATATELRVLVDNQPGSAVDRFTLQWATAAGDLAQVEPTSIYVPQGTSRFVRVPRPPAASAADRLILRGDDDTFDNTLYFVPSRQEDVSVVYLGAEGANDSTGLRYYLQRALVDSPQRKLSLVAVAGDEPLTADLLPRMRLAVVMKSLSDQQAALLQRYLAAGGTVLVVLADADAAPLSRLLNLADIRLTEAAGPDFALLAEVSYLHPLFASLADPRFSDFTKIHFWKHRRVQLPATSDVRVLAKFDNGDPAVLERHVGAGRVIVLASTWRPADSQLALSTKFVPLLMALLDRQAEASAAQTQFLIGDQVPQAGGSTGPGTTPGVYLVAGRRFALNVAPAESRTAPLSTDELEQRGVRLSSAATRERQAERRRQRQVAELENQQKLWQWLIAAVLGLVIAETVLSGRTSRRPRSASGAEAV